MNRTRWTNCQLKKRNNCAALHRMFPLARIRLVVTIVASNEAGGNRQQTVPASPSCSRSGKVGCSVSCSTCQKCCHFCYYAWQRTSCSAGRNAGTMGLSGLGAADLVTARAVRIRRAMHVTRSVATLATPLDLLIFCLTHRKNLSCPTDTPQNSPRCLLPVACCLLPVAVA